MRDEKRKQLVVVLGMHRSGTSAIARAMQALGVDLGNNLMPPIKDNNEKGFFEDVEINKLNIELFEALESDWHGLSHIPNTLFEPERLASFKMRAVGIMRAKMGDKPFGMKDPRIGRLLPFWHSVWNHLNVKPFFIIAVRNPLSVAKSLHRRDGFDNEKSYYLWLAHVLPSMLETRGMSRLVVDYDLLMAAPQSQLKRLALALDLPYSDSSSSVGEYVENFLSLDLRHSQFEFEDIFIDPAVPGDVSLAYKLLISFARDETNIDAPEVEEIFSQLKTRLKALAPALNYMTRSDKRAFEQDRTIVNLKQHGVNLSQIVAERDFEIADLKQHSANLSQVVVERESEIVNLKQHGVNLSQIVAERDFEIADLKQHSANLSQIVAERDFEIADLKQHSANLSQFAVGCEVEIDSLKQYVINLQESLAESEKRIGERAEFLEEQLKDAELKINEFLSSKSWRITEPLRSLKRGLKIKCRPKNRGEADQLTIEDDNIHLGFHHVEQQSSLELVDSNFDADFYRKAYPDTCGLDPYFHYLNFGKSEGRLSCTPIPITIDELKKIDRFQETVLVVSHEASRTGAPILALNIAQHFKEKKYNVIAFLLRGGELLTDFQECCDIVIEPFPQSNNPSIVSTVLEKLISQADLKFAIVNSILSRSVLPVLSNNFITSLCLIHEFASYTYPKNAIRDVVFWANQVIFSARIVSENNATQCEMLEKSKPIILPQGKCTVPHENDVENLNGNEKERIRKLFRPDPHLDDTIVILGAGYVQLRKGVDLFLACAARVVALCPLYPVRFVWVGHGFDPDLDMAYSVYLQDQIIRAGLENHFCFAGEMSDIDLAYELSDVLFLSSRLDPLPNVAIDAMFRQLPVICFDGATGIADLLTENGLGEACVIPYLDVEQAAQRIFSLIEDAEERVGLGRETKKLAEKEFDMKSYVNSLERHAIDCLAMHKIEKSDCALIEEAGALNLDFFSPPAWPALSYKKAVRAFVRSWKTGIDLRKPFAGFHPGIYEESRSGYQSGRNPLAAFIQDGNPKGPWLSDLIQPSPIVQMKNIRTLRVALHIHVFFVNLFHNMLQRLEGQGFSFDLLISVPSLEIAQEVSALTSGFSNGIVDIRIVPNRGRDIGPLLTEFNEVIIQNYDVIGHIHTKKSGDVKDSIVGPIWLKFLLENLIGKEYPMAATILERMAGDEKLGLVFPDDPNVVGWSGNKQIAEDIAGQYGVQGLSSAYFNFPVGNMFWARCEAIKPLLIKGLRWEDYPLEPLPYDGTILHALERLLPFVVKKMGYKVSMTHVPGITR